MVDNKGSFFAGRHLTYKDFSGLISLVSNDIGKAHIAPSWLHMIYLLATNSKKYDSENIPDNVVTLNSEVILVTNEIQKQLVKILLPQNIKGNKDISVYSPIGIAILGKQEKDEVFVNYNKTIHKIKIEKIVFQPEKEKMYHL